MERRLGILKNMGQWLWDRLSAATTPTKKYSCSSLVALNDKSMRSGLSNKSGPVVVDKVRQGNESIECVNAERRYRQSALSSGCIDSDDENCNGRQRHDDDDDCRSIEARKVGGKKERD